MHLSWVADAFKRYRVFVPQITMAQSSKDRSIIFGTAVRKLSPGAFGILLIVPLEPLERELAAQVEYDMDEQGALIKGCWRVPALTF